MSANIEPVTPRKRVETALRRSHADRVPFTMYECKIPQCSAERALRNRGLCIVKRDVPVFKTHRPNVRVSQHVFWEEERQMTRTLYETPVAANMMLPSPTRSVAR